MGKKNDKTGKQPAKIALHAIRKPHQRTLPWAVPSKETPGPSTLIIERGEIEEDIYSHTQAMEESMCLMSYISDLRRLRQFPGKFN